MRAATGADRIPATAKRRFCNSFNGAEEAGPHRRRRRQLLVLLIVRRLHAQAHALWRHAAPPLARRSLARRKAHRLRGWVVRCDAPSATKKLMRSRATSEREQDPGTEAGSPKSRGSRAILRSARPDSSHETSLGCNAVTGDENCGANQGCSQTLTPNNSHRGGHQHLFSCTLSHLHLVL